LPGGNGVVESAVRADVAPARHLAVEGERRQLTVMFCDLVDSTALGEQLDPEELHEVVHAYQMMCAEVIARHDGHISQYAGDGLVVYFGYPLAHENDAERALRAGLEILDASARLNGRLQKSHGIRLALRIGVHSGPVVVAGTCGDDQREKQVLGHTVNLAARLQAVAEPDSVVTTAATLNLAPGFFVTTDLGALPLKGIAEPVVVHRIVRRSGARTRLEGTAVAIGLTPFVGREQDLALLVDRFEQTAEGCGQVVLLNGEAGIGKSRLLQVFRERLGEQPHLWLEGHCSPYHENSAFRPVIDLLEQALRLGPDDAPATKIAALERALAPTGLPLETIVPLMASLLSVPLSDAYAPSAISADGQRHRTLDALVAWLVSLGTQQPCVVALEDLHWIDPSTRELLGILVEQSATARMLLVVTSRPGVDAPWPNRSNATQLTLHPLARSHVAAMIERLAGGRTVPPEVSAHVVAKTDGVPLFVEELTKAVLESELLRETASGYERSGARPTFAVPSTLQDSLTARLDRLGPVKEIAQLGSVLGREFSYDLLRAIAPADAAFVDHALRELARAELVYPRGLAPHATYRFKHALVQEAAYRSLLRSRRQDAHARIVCALETRFPERVEAEPEELGRHCAAAGLAPEAARYYRVAGQRAAQRSAHAEAIGHLTRGLELLARSAEGPERDRQELELRVALGFPLVALHGYGDSRVEEAYERARVLCHGMDEAPHLFETVWGLANYYQARGVLDVAKDLAEQLVTIAENAAETRLAVWAHLQLGATLFFRGEPAASLRHLDLAIAQHDPSVRWFLTGAPEPGAAARVYAAWALWELGHPDRALRVSEEGVALGRACEHPFTLALALAFHATLRQIRLEPDACRETAEEVIALSTAQEYPLWRGMGHVLRGWAMARSGRGDGGIGEMQQGVALLSTTGTEVGSSSFFFQLADATWAAGRASDALAIVQTGLGIAQQRDHGLRDADLHRLYADILLATDSEATAEAEQCYRVSLERARSQRKTAIELRAAMGLYRLLRRRGTDAAEAREDAPGDVREVHGGLRHARPVRRPRPARGALTGSGRGRCASGSSS
jgi:class 3 adenylate cyclase/tetratricopeptide (TPR) repeat protein